MAELFKPEIREQGGTNVTAYSPTTMDFSGLFQSINNVFEQRGTSARVDKPSEAEVKNATLEPYLTKIEKIMTSDLPEVQKYAKVNGIKTEALRLYPAYRESFEGAATGIVNTIDPDGDAIQRFYEDRNAWEKTAEGQARRVQAMNKATTKDGLNEEVYTSSINALYMQSLTDAQNLADQKTRNQMNIEGKKEVFVTEFLPKADKDIKDDIKMFTEGTGLKIILDQIQSAPLDPGSALAGRAIVLADLIKQRGLEMKALLLNKQSQGGYPLNDPEFNIDKLIESNYTVLESALRNSAESVGKALNTLNADNQASYLAGLPSIEKQLIYMKEKFPETIVTHYSNLYIANNNNPAFLNSPKNNTPFDLGFVMHGTGETRAIESLPAAGEISLNELQKTFPEFNPKQVEKVGTLSPEQKKTAITDGGNQIKGAVVTDAATSQSVAWQLGGSYLVIASRLKGDVEKELTPLDQTKLFFGPSAMNLIDNINKYSPVDGKNLYSQVNKTINTEAIRHIEALAANITSRFPNNPFQFVVNDKGLVDIVVSENAKKNDPLIKSIIAPKRGQRSNLTGRDILQQATSLFSSIGGNEKLVNNAIESLNTLLLASNRLPKDIKDSTEFSGMTIRMLLDRIPKYSGPGAPAFVIEE